MTLALLKDGWRALRRAPGLSLAAVLSLALGIGANTAVFSTTHALLLQPLPYAGADRLVILWNRSPGLNITEDWFSTAQYFDIRTRHTGLEDVAIAYGANANLTGDTAPERVGTIRVSSNLLPMLGASPLWGRLFEPAEDRPGAAPAAVLGHGLWQRRFGASPDVVGRAISINGVSHTVVGVLAATFRLPREVMPTLGVVADGDVYLPLPLADNAPQVRTAEDYNLLARLKPGVSLTDAQREMDGLTAALRQEHPDVYPPNGGLTFSLVPLLDQVVGDIRPILRVLMVAVGGVLLIACANVANLLLARALDRRREIAVRVALGATRAQIVRQLLAESLLLALTGAVAGVWLAWLGIGAIQAMQPADLPRLGDIAINTPVLLFTLAIATAAGLLFGLAPVAAITTSTSALHEGARGASAGGLLWGRGHGLRRALVVAQLALAVMLLIGAGLLVRSYARLQAVSPGFSAEGVLTLELTLTGPRYPNAAAVRSTYRDLWAGLEAVPGVTAAGGVTALPLSNFFAWGPITIEGRAPQPGEAFINADQRTVGGRYFEAMHIPLLQGRLFTRSDTADQPRVVIIDARLARDLFPGESALGRRLKFGDAASASPWETIVGVVGEVTQYALGEDSRIALYRPLTQSGARSLFVVARTEGDPRAVMPAATRIVTDLDAALPIYRMMTMEDRVAASLGQRRFVMLMLGLFAAIALVLAILGVMGVMAYVVARGTRDLGIRLALGAAPGDLMRLILGQGGRLAVAGVALGVGGAWLGSGVMASLLYGLAATDVPTFVVMAATLLVCALGAIYLPARRAASIDPLVSLRHE